MISFVIFFLFITVLLLVFIHLFVERVPSGATFSEFRYICIYCWGFLFSIALRGWGWLGLALHIIFICYDLGQSTM